MENLFRKELELALLRDAETPQDLSQVYSLRQQRLEAMAARVVTIQACGSLGSGVILDSYGHIATNAHVVSNTSGICNRIVVSTAQGWQGTAQVVAGEYEQDIAIIRVENPQGFSGVVIAPQIYLGQDVFAVGHPLGISHTVTRGVISYPRRMVDKRPYVQTDASINPGNSGGGLFDELGRLVGLPTFKEVWADKNRTIPVANIGFAVPGDVVQAFYSQAFRRDLAMSCSGDPEAAHKAIILG
ncbi:MAG: S1C family serine protease [Bacillota bacterium]|jgi:S1-C subfamily serine protease